MSKNVWELYSSMKGWERIEAILDNATASALSDADAAIAKGTSYPDAASAAFNAVLKVMERPNVTTYGGSDSEPRDTLGSKIAKHMNEKYKAGIFVDRFGDVHKKWES